MKRKHFISRSERKRSLLWLVIIVVVALILGALVARIPSYVEKFYHYGDESYRPMDLDRDPDRDKSDYIYYKE
ncbi:MAG: hypothetical protein Q7J15_02390 [Candidatus Desulfaltia sp.]|nr:hypothetical protein [Candidatus Desulfaltia sp.]